MNSSKNSKISTARKMDNETPQPERNKPHLPWIAMGVGAGTAIGVALKNISIGVAIGAALGLALNTAMRRKRRSEEKP